MGCKLTPIIKSHTVNFNSVYRKTVAIDGTNFLIRYLSKLAFVNKKTEEIASHIIGLFYFTINLMERKLRPIFVFDGMPIKEKRHFSSYKISKLLYLWNQYRNHEKQITDFDFTYDKNIVECIEFIKMMGLPVIRAPSEGEAQASRLVRDKKAFGVISYDYDTLLFGSKIMLKALDFNTESLTIIRLKENLENWGITYKQLVDMALLIGTDLNKDGVKGIGPKKALKLIKKHGNLETINDEVISLEFDFKKLRKKFLHPPSVEFAPMFLYPNFQMLRKILINILGKNRLDTGIKRLKKAFKFFKMEQKTIDCYLM
ncbi:MAG: hypothetical protein ACTSR3_12910 [Candidatus Helarchaeota archaeon]